MKRIYHFLSEKNALDDLKGRKLKISSFNDLNDPFEYLDCEFSKADFHNAFDEMKKSMYKKTGVICFSKNWNNTLMWSHYADKHKGICLGFDVSDSIELTELEYIGNKETLCDDIEQAVNQNLPNEEYEAMKKLLSSKYKGWDYEDEIRMFCSLEETDINGYYFYDLNNHLTLRQVILGLRCSKTKEELLGVLAKHNYFGVEAIKARLDFQTFEVVEDN